MKNIFFLSKSDILPLQGLGIDRDDPVSIRKKTLIYVAKKASIILNYRLINKTLPIFGDV